MVDGGGRRFASWDLGKNIRYENISKTTRYFYLIVSGPHKRVQKISFGMFRIGKCSNKIILNFFEEKFFEEKKSGCVVLVVWPIIQPLHPSLPQSLSTTQPPTHPQPPTLPAH